LKPSVYIKPNGSKPDLFWRANDSKDWELFKSSLQLEFDNFSLIDDNVGNVDCTWEVWNGKVTEVANKTIGKTKRMKNYRQFWDKELDQLLKRIHDKNHSADSTLGTLLAESYRKRKEVVQNAIRRRETFVKNAEFS
jgi:hypothetical protein